MKSFRLATLGLVAMTCACASGPRNGPPGGGPGPDFGPGGPQQGSQAGGSHPGRQVFVSPFGEPFEAGPGEPYPVAVWFAGADIDHDGRLTPAEFDADGLRWFGVLDTDRDGRIGPIEIAAYEAMVGARLTGQRGGEPGEGRGPGGGDGGHGERGGPPGGAALNDQIGGQDMPGGGGGPGGGGPGGDGQPGGGGQSRGLRPVTTPLAMANLLGLPQPVKAADQDVNQFITAQEWAQASHRWFTLLDRDHDGVLTMAELPRTGLQRGEGRGRGPGGPR